MVETKGCNDDLWFFTPGVGDFLWSVSCWRKTLSVSPSASFWCGADPIAKDQVFFCFPGCGKSQIVL